MATARIDSHPMSARASAVLFLFFVSGLCGLIYESVWSHYVKLFLGHAAYAQTLVLVVFIGGLVHRRRALPRAAARLPHPLRPYPGGGRPPPPPPPLFPPRSLAGPELGFRAPL